MLHSLMFLIQMFRLHPVRACELCSHLMLTPLETDQGKARKDHEMLRYG